MKLYETSFVGLATKLSQVTVNFIVNLDFTYESRDTLKSLTLFITVKVITKLNPGHRKNIEIELI